MAGENTVFLPPDDGTPMAGTMGRIGQGSGVTWRNFICLSSHPVPAFFHLAFKAAAAVLYIFANWFGLDFVTAFVLVILLLAFDFWTVKNISGRLLVGLRWWVHVKEDGRSEWLFESAPDSRVPYLDYRIFWWALYGAPLLWFVLGLSALLSFAFSWLVVDAVGVALTGANLFGYMRASSDAQARIQSAITGGAMAGLRMLPGGLPALGNTLMSFMAASASAAAAAPATAAAAPATAAPAGATAPQLGAAAAKAHSEHNPFDERVVL